MLAIPYLVIWYSLGWKSVLFMTFPYEGLLVPFLVDFTVPVDFLVRIIIVNTLETTDTRIISLQLAHLVVQHFFGNFWCLKRLQIVCCFNNDVCINLSISYKKNFASFTGHQSSKFRIKLWFLKTITLKWTSLDYSLDLGKPAISLFSNVIQDKLLFKFTVNTDPTGCI